MKITDILNSKPVTLSFEVFPPGSHAAFEATAAAASQIAALSPAFLSVTYGAGGGTSEYTLGLAEEIRAKNNVEAMTRAEKRLYLVRLSLRCRADPGHPFAGRILHRRRLLSGRASRMCA